MEPVTTFCETNVSNIPKEELYKSLLYQTTNNIYLMRDKKQRDQLEEYISEIFEISSTDHEKHLKAAREASKPNGRCNITIAGIDGVKIESPADADKKNQFYVTADWSCANVKDKAKDIAGTTMKEVMQWNETIILYACR